MLQGPRSSLSPLTLQYFNARKNHQPALPVRRSVTCKRRTLSLGAGTSVTATFEKNTWTIREFPHPVFKILPYRFLVLFLQNHAAKSARVRDEVFVSFVKQWSKEAVCDRCCSDMQHSWQNGKSRRKTRQTPSEERMKGSVSIDKSV